MIQIIAIILGLLMLTGCSHEPTTVEEYTCNGTLFDHYECRIPGTNSTCTNTIVQNESMLCNLDDIRVEE